MKTGHLFRRVLFCLLVAFAAGCRATPGAVPAGDHEVLFSRNADIPSRLVELIDEAREEVLVATYSVNLRSVLLAIERAAARGVRTAVLADPERRGALAHFKVGEVVPGEPFPGLVHAKFGAVDRRVAWIGSLNLTYNSAYLHDDDLVIVDNPSLASFLAAALESLGRGLAPDPASWRGEIGAAPAAVFLNPECPGALAGEIAAAREEIFFSLYFLTDSDIIDLLAEAAGRGVRVSGVLERSVPANREARARLVEAGAEVRWSRNHHLNHYKAFVFDRRRVLTGSYNPTASAPSNQEIILVLDKPGLAGKYLARLGARPF